MFVSLSNFFSSIRSISEFSHTFKRKRRSPSFFPFLIHGAIKSNVKAAFNRKYCFSFLRWTTLNQIELAIYLCGVKENNNKIQRKMQRNDKNRREIIYWFAKVNKEAERRRIRKKSCHFVVNIKIKLKKKKNLHSFDSAAGVRWERKKWT